MIKKYVKNFAIYSIVVAVLMIVVAVSLITRPLTSMSTILCIFGGILAVSGAVSVIGYFRKRGVERLTSFDLLTGFATLIAAVMIIVYRAQLMHYIPIIIGIWIVLCGLIGIQVSINLCFAHFKRWPAIAILSVLELAIGLLLINKPDIIALSSVKIAGIFLLVNEAVIIVKSIMLLVNLKKLQELEPIEVEVIE